MRLASVLFLAGGITLPAHGQTIANTSPSEPAAKSASPKNDELITIDFRDAELSNVLRSLSYTYQLNLVTARDIKGKVTVSLQDVTIDEALEAILSSNNLVFERKGNIVYITGKDQKEDLKEKPSSKILRLKYSSVTDAQNLIRKVLSPEGDIRVDEATNTLVITDYPEYLEVVMSLLQEIDMPPQQVIIEAKIVDITSQDLQNLGLTWSHDYTPVGRKKGLFSRNTGATEAFDATFRMAGSSTSLDGGQFTLDALSIKGFDLTATIDALIQDQKAQLLASPSIAVINNQEARIVIGEKVPFKERTQTTTGTTETTKFIDVGTTLRVTPTINTDGYITMRIHPEVSSVSTLLDAGPRITTREADTTVRIKESETVVIAGLIRHEDNRTESELPFIRKVPIIKHLLSSRSKDELQTELAVFITPSILHSREERARLSKEEIHDREAVIQIPSTGSLALVRILYQTAEQLEHGEGLESRRKPEWSRLKQAMNLYENIATDFPDSPKADQALYRAAHIRYNTFLDYEGAQRTLHNLIERYPDSGLVPAAQGLLSEVEAHLQREATENLPAEPLAEDTL
jgi:type IV pilus assembly protein PilQ